MIEDNLKKSVENILEDGEGYEEFEFISKQDKFTTTSPDDIVSVRFFDQFMRNHKGFIAGGCFKNLIQGDKVKDIDVFFEDYDDFVEAVKHYDLSEEYSLLYSNRKAVGYKHESGIVLDLVRAMFGTPEDVISQFDFSISKMAYYKETDEEDVLTYRVVHHEEYFKHLTLKRLVLNPKIKYPISTFERMIRYVGYGYKPCRETKVNLLISIQSWDQDVEVSASLYDGMD